MANYNLPQPHRLPQKEKDDARKAMAKLGERLRKQKEDREAKEDATKPIKESRRLSTIEKAYRDYLKQAKSDKRKYFKAGKLNVKEGKDIVANVPGTIPQPIPKKFVKKASGGQDLAKEGVDPKEYDTPRYKAATRIINKVAKKVRAETDAEFKKKYAAMMKPAKPDARMIKKEEVAGFADASAPSNSNYQTELSPTQTAKRKPKMKKKTVRETYERRMVELADICPSCNNTGVTRRMGMNQICDAPGCSAGTDKRVDKENLMFTQARDMIATGKTTAVAEVVSSLDDLSPVLEDYKASSGHLGRTRHLVQPKLSKTLRDRLDARKASGVRKSKGYVASKGTMGLAMARRAQMSHSKEVSPKGYPEEVKSLHHPEIADSMAHKKSPPRGVNEANKKKPNLSASTPGKAMASLSAKPMMGSSNDNRMSEEHDKYYEQGHTHGYQHKPPQPPTHPQHAASYMEGHAAGTFDRSQDSVNDSVETKSGKPLNELSFLIDGESKKFTGSGKAGLKRKYLGAMRGRTATGKPAHPIEVDPVLKTDNNLNKVVR